MAKPPSPEKVFVYGTLLAPEVVRTLLGRVPQQRPARLHDHHRYKISGRLYPAVAPLKGAQVRGQLLSDLTERERLIVDEFEDDWYNRERVTVHLEDDDQKVEALAFIGDPKPELYGEWSYEEFREKGISPFLETCHEFLEELKREWGDH